MRALNPVPSMKNSLLPILASALLFGAAFSSARAADPVRLRVELDRPVLPAGSAERAVIKVALDGVRLPRPDARPPVNLALVIDRSGSMQGEKIQKAREAALEALSRLAADDIISVVTYGGDVKTVLPAQRVGDGRSAGDAIRAIRADGGTPLFAGVSQGASELRKNLGEPRYVHRLLLMSDGLANEGPSTPDELGRLGTALGKEGITVTTFGLGLDFNEDLMTRLARRSDGNTYFVESAADLPRMFAAELGDVLNVVARAVMVTVRFPDGVRPVAFVGREGAIRGQVAEVALSQLYGGQEKFALIEAEVMPGRASDERLIATATATFEEAGTRRSLSLTVDTRARFSADRDSVVRAANAKVQADWAANTIAVARDRAVELADAGRRAEAAALLRARANELETVGRIYSNSAVISISAANSAAATDLGANGMSNTTRKDWRASNVQTYNQQSVGK
jgi:Ca-activated chloride channel family protein